MGRLRRVSAAEAATLVVLAVWGVAPLVLMLRHAAATGDTFTGSDGPFAADQLQYLSWIREAGQHVLAGNAFDLRPSEEVFLHPMFLLSGVAWKLGLGLQASYLAWMPVAIAVLFAGFASFVRRTVAGRGARAAALVLALFYIPPTAYLLGRTGVGSIELHTKLADVIGEVFPAGQLWGYLPTVIAVGAMPLYLLAAERGLAERAGPRRRALGLAALAGLVASWLHPWQGAVLAVVTVGLLAWGRLRRPVLPLLAPLVVTLLPLLYYAALSRLDAAWEIASRQNQEPHLEAWLLVAGVGPVLPLAVVGALRRPRDLSDRALLLWPVAAFAVYAALRQVPAHALEGVSLPLAVLSVRVWQALRLGGAGGILAVAALTVPGAVFAADGLRDLVSSGQQPHYLRPAEARAMEALRRDQRPGGVIADLRLAAAVPAHAGRSVWAGHPSWTARFSDRARDVHNLFDGRARGSHAVRLLRGSKARFALAGCGSRADILVSAPSAVLRARRLGCATVYELRMP